MAEPVALIAGASRGLGLGLARELTGRGWRVIGTVRAPSAAPGGFEAATLDVTDPASVAALRGRLAGTRLDLVFVNAGVSGPAHQDAGRATAEELGVLFATNAAGPIGLARALLPLVVPETGVVAFMTSRMGSVAANETGDMALYRASKAALNSLVRSFGATQGREVAVLALHPGWVRTDMGGPDAPLDVATSARGLADVLEASRGTRRHAFLDHRGNAIPW